ncbi:MAG: polysaccharide ABC transporter ATP-binding protein [Betaproteobacteria bacterium]|nr:polysaccharide ABC transporter ATP-binding protein [Betaproteobacteria bacterium]MDH5350204.1 polysaccharide ABC transporter ATP-binding protein [Betaproteobacteria bacterium]
MTAAISATRLGKRYFLDHEAKAPYATLREALAHGTRGLGRKLLGAREARSREEFWALRDVSFDIAEGERVGVIGRNGAGKSTLLKLLSRITEPTTGRIVLQGRIASLLEVGTGFHPELSGRENIFLNGAILGMPRTEIRRKFDEIVAFAEIERFLDTPVKRYSSGMYVRLAFAVAAHLEPDILVVDEVLAVGDAEFQRKCLGKMKDIGRQGRTVLFVSHNMQAIRQLCSRCIVLDAGTIASDDTVDAAIASYLQQGPHADSSAEFTEYLSRLPPDPALRFERVSIRQDGEERQNVVNGKDLELLIDYSVFQDTEGLRVYFILYDIMGTALFRSFLNSEVDPIPVARAGRYRAIARLPADLLAPITYRIGISATVHNVRRCYPDEGVMTLRVEDSGQQKNAYAHGGEVGVKLAPLIPWTVSAR